MDNLDSDVSQPEPKKLPFENLFLNAGVVEGGNKPWMYLLGIMAVVFSYLIIGGLLIMPLVAFALEAGVTADELARNQYVVFDPVRLGINKNIILMVQFGLFVAAFIGLFLAVKLIHRKRFISVVTGFEKFRYSKFFFAFMLWASILVISMLVTYFSSPGDLKLQFDATKFFQLFLVCIVFLPIQTLTEEVFFRGYMLQGLSQVFRNGIIPLIITSFFFASAHMSNPETGAYGPALMFTYYFVFAVFLSAITLLSEGLELAYGIHLSNNLISALMVTSDHSVLKTDAIFYTTAEDAGAELVLAICTIVAVFVVFLFKYRWRNFSLIIK